MVTLWRYNASFLFLFKLLLRSFSDILEESRETLGNVWQPNLPNIRKPLDGFRTQDLSIERRLTLSLNRLTQPPRPHLPPSPPSSMRPSLSWSWIYNYIDRNGQHADELLPTQANSSTHVSSWGHHIIFTYFRVQ